MKLFLYKILFIVLIGCCTTACEDELCSQELVAFMRDWSREAVTIKKDNFADGTTSITGVNTLKFPVYLSREATVGVEATMKVDESAVARYNEDNGTDYELFPAEAFSFLNDVVTIPSGSLQSPDSVKLNFNYENIEPGEYLLPLALKSVVSEDKGIRASTTASIVYYKFTVVLDNVNNADVEVSGEEINRSGWEIVCDDVPNPSKPVANLIDGDVTTDWAGTKKVQSLITVDMGQEQTLKGFSYYHGGLYNDAPTKFQIYVSKDGKRWFSQGEAGRFIFSSSIQEKEYGMNFFIPVTCRYFRLKITATTFSTSYGARFSELNAIK